MDLTDIGNGNKGAFGAQAVALRPGSSPPREQRESKENREPAISKPCARSVQLLEVFEDDGDPHIQVLLPLGRREGAETDRSLGAS